MHKPAAKPAAKVSWRRRTRLLFAAGAAVALFGQGRRAFAQSWVGSLNIPSDPTSGNWSVAGDWNPASVPASANTTTLTFNSGLASYTADNDIAGTFQLLSLTFGGSSAVPIEVDGNDLEFPLSSNSFSTITQNSAAAVTIDNNISLDKDVQVNYSGTGATTINGNISGTGSLTMSGAGALLVLTGTNTYTGGTAVRGGTLQIGTATAGGSLKSGAVVTSGTLTVAALGKVAASSGAAGSAGTNNPSGAGGNGGNGAGGGVGVEVESTGILSNLGTVTGGAGGAGGTGGAGAQSNEDGMGGAGGSGESAVELTNRLTFTNEGTINGGAGGAGGSSLFPDSAYFGNGGSGGVGVFIPAGGSLDNNGTITGGVGGLTESNGGAGGPGVVFNDGGTLTNTQTIGGGQGGFGSFRGADGIGVSYANGIGELTNQGSITGDVEMDNFANQVTLFTGSSITGGLDISENTGTTLTLDGGGTQSFSTAVTGTTTFNGSLTKQGAGTWTLDQAFTYAGTTSVTQGTLQIDAPLSGAGAMTVGTNARVNIIGGSASVGGLSIATGGVVNVNTTLAVNYGSPSAEDATVNAIVAALTIGYNGGAWTGTSAAAAVITSSAAAAGNANGILSVGYADGNTDTGTPATANQILVMLTLAGDANLDGIVNFNDLDVVGQHLNTSGNDWADGNFNYDANGAVNFNDLDIVGQNLNKTINDAAIELGGSTVPLGQIARIQDTDATPEPGAAVVAAMGAAMLFRRRRRTSRFARNSAG
jgi:uncharacterized protein (TIGR03382 family)